MQKTINRKTASPEIQVHVITPDIAAAWLDKNISNRKRNKRHVDKYARDMASKAWRLTGDAIRFDDGGNLIDGQHRLAACVQAGMPFESVVIYNLRADVTSTIDTGKPRTMSDVLTMAGTHYATTVAAIARIMLDEKYGFEDSTAWTHQDMLGMIDRHPRIHAAAREVVLAKLPRGIRFGPIATIYLLGATVLHNEPAADAFFDVFKTGIPRGDNCPAHQMREKLLRSGSGTVILKRREAWRGVKTAWNLFAQGKTTTRLRWAGPVEIEGLDRDKL
jgi:hypothetical protein